ncbi:glycosyltransferase [Microbacterium sp. A204]|uniref:glycosyltransferase n=1 Tax=Microbacterium sp. A204 TaxID=3457321 RepID=UPI003FD5D64D
MGDRSLPDAEYLVLSSRLIPDLDGGYTVATLARARALVGAGVNVSLLTFDPGDATAHAEHRSMFTQRGAIDAPSRLRNLFDEAVTPEGGAAQWLRTAASADLSQPREAREYRMLRDAEYRPFAALPVIPGNPDWHLTDEPVLVYDEYGSVVGGVAGFRGLYRAWLEHLTAGFGDRPIVIICESRQLGELIADWDDPRVRIIHTIHTMHLEAPYTPDAPMNALWTRWFALADRFDAVAWPTQRQRDDVAARFGESIRSIVMPNGIEITAGEQCAPEPGLVISLSRLAPGKRIDHIIRAFLAADVPGSTLEIWGGGPSKQDLETLIAELGCGDRVLLCGVTATPAEVLERAAVVVSASAFEGQGLSLAEALAHSCPVVSYDIRYGPSDLLAAGGGLLVPDGDEHALAAALTRVLTEPALYERLAHEAPAAASVWSSERSLAALAAAARDVLDAPARR